MKTKYDWLKVPDDVKWIATNGNGKVSGFISNLYDPRLVGDLWYGSDYYTGEPKYYGLDIEPCSNYQDSLEQRP